ncbi:Cof-type HAD-IIB family hydrolase [Alkalihalobacterium alkalinitrilicum]|uniref:Cof-type HAD-IIB family hydrolase n=1 Tax=Alkalihalobacterium alkalinitrilicum TaxID=427920 RepID=UPI000994BBF5|nr:Cof-type HAD-IIB family hydrolase [Alkalihalobacterium alkalinitrilicum]
MSGREDKIVFFDIDGTLYDHSQTIPSSTVTAINELQNNGIHIAIATGRAPFMYKELRKQLGIQTYISFNGSYVIFNNNVIYKNPLETEKLKKLENEAIKNKHPMVFLDHNNHYANSKEHPFIKESIGSMKLHLPDYNPEFYHSEEVYQALIFCENDSEDLYISHHTHFDYVRWHQYSIDVLPNGGSKAKGVEILLDQLNIPVDNAYAFGDGLNDIEMLSYVGTGVAMGNGHKDAKEAANIVTNSVDDHGILIGLQKVGLL